MEKKGDFLSIVVLSKKNIDLLPYRVTLKIYDALGNIVNDSPMKMDGKQFIYKWDTYNKQKRLVGAGTFVANVNIYDGDNQVWTGRCKLGVKRGSK